MFKRKKDRQKIGLVEETLGGMSEYNKLLEDKTELELLEEASIIHKGELSVALQKASIKVLNANSNQSLDSIQLALQVYRTIVSEYSAIKNFIKEINNTIEEIDSVVSKIQSALKIEKTLNIVGEAIGSSLTGQTLLIPTELTARIYSLKQSSNLSLHSTKALLELRSKV